MVPRERHKEKTLNAKHYHSESVVYQTKTYQGRYSDRIEKKTGKIYKPW